MKRLNDVMCAGWRYPYVSKVTIQLKQCVPRVLKLASSIQNKSKIRFRKYQRDCIINKKYIALRVFLDHHSYNLTFNVAVLLNLLSPLRKSDKILSKPHILLFFHNSFNLYMYNNTPALM